MSITQRPLPPHLAELATALGLRGEVTLIEIRGQETLAPIYFADALRPPPVTASGRDADVAFAAVCTRLEAYARATASTRRQRATAARRIANDAEREATAADEALKAFDAGDGVRS